MIKRLLLLAGSIWLMCLAAVAAPGDIKCSGTVVDDQGEPIVGATISVPGTSLATATDIDGRFSLNVPAKKSIRVNYIGFRPVTLEAKEAMGDIQMETESQMLKDVVVEQSIAKTRLTPVAVSTVGAQTIDLKLGNQELPEVLKTTPGVWVTRDGGGFGDSKINMRGFQSKNTAVMVNGIPINDMEWGGVYNSNWAGLGDIIANIQTQRGLGATIVSTPSIGGTINYTTRTIDVEKGGRVWYGMGNDGYNQYGVKLSTGLMKNGWAFTVLGARKWGDGYIQGTQFNSFNYFVNISKRINDQHQLSLTATGAPQTHDQRSSQNGLSIMGYQTYGKRFMNGESMYRYNPTFGYDNQGRMRNSSRNFYHKPHISLNHIWQIDETSSLSSAIYASIGSGGGYSGQGNGIDGYTYSKWYGASNGVLNMEFRAADGTFDYGAIQDLNAESTVGSYLVMSKSINAHQWYGLVSSYKKEIEQSNGNRLNITGGLDLRYYMGKHTNEISDLYDGEYFMDYSSRKNVKPELNAAAADPNWQYEKLGIGDIVYRNYRGYIVQEGVYAQGEYTMLENRLNIVLSGALNNNTYWRKDFFYYDKEHAKSATTNFIGGTIKGGANYNIDEHNNVFVNLGYISRAPYFSGGVFLQATTSNAINKKAVNEKVMSYEIGYGYKSRSFSLLANAYYTRWMDRTTTRGDEFSDGSGRYYINLQGVDARHTGIEVNFNWVPTRWLNIEGMVSWGDWIWDSNASGYFYNGQGQPLKNLSGEIASGIGAEDHAYATVNQKGVKVGGSAQTTGSLSATFIPFKGFRIGADWLVSARNYSDFEVKAAQLNANTVINVADPWRIPWGQQVDLHASYRFNIAGVKATLYGNVNNLFNYNYVVDAYTDNTTRGTWENAYRVFYSFGRTYSVRMQINF